MSLARSVSNVATVIRCLVETERSGGHHQKGNTNMYGIIVETATKKLFENVRKFVNP